MTPRRATIARVAAFAIAALVLSGCIKLDMALTVNSDDTVDGTLIFGVSKQLLELTGQSPEDLLAEAPIPTDVEGVSSEPYEDEEFQGQQVTLDGVPLDEFNQGSFAGGTGATGATASADQLRIIREGNNYVVSGAFDLSSVGASTGATGATGFPGAEELFRSAEMKISITFPGEVVRSNGRVDGSTVTWTPRVGERLEIQATGSARGGGDGSTMMILLIVGGVVIVAAIVAGILMSRRRRPAMATAGTAPRAGTGPAAGQGPMTPTTPPAAAPPPPPPPPSEPHP
jgi:hypothetical protein